MNGKDLTLQSDLWSEWLLHRRHAGDDEFDRIVQQQVNRFADRVLASAKLAEGMTVIDIGCGDGRVGLRAIDQVGPSLNVTLADISRPLLRHAEEAALQRGVHSQCRFVQCSAEHLEGISDNSMDRLMTRAALAYVPDKAAAFREFHRVLNPGGLISLAEPILQDEAFATCAMNDLIRAGAKAANEPIFPLLHRCKASQYPDTLEGVKGSAISNFSERDLVNLAKAAGFERIHLELHIDVGPSTIPSWDVYLDTSPHPLAPSIRQILREKFSPQERELFENVMRPTVEARRLVSTDRVAFLTASKST